MHIIGTVPWFEAPWHDGIFGIPIQPFGVIVAIGVLIGAWMCRVRGKQLGIDEDDVRVLTGYLLVAGFLGAHYIDLFFYQPHKLKEDPALLYEIWNGISSFGGFVGAAVGFVLFTHFFQKRMRKKDPSYRVDRLKWADISLFGTLPGFAIGRLGCTMVHDHLGSQSKGEFFLAIDTCRIGPAPCTATHELGLYELVYLTLLFIVLMAITKGGKARRVGFNVAFIALCYGAVRFFLDRLRPTDSDPRYFGLTFAQYTSVATFFIGLYMFWYVYARRPRLEAALAQAAAEREATADASRGKKKKKSKTQS